VALTIREAAQQTGWSPRMLRYVEQVGLVRPQRSPGGIRRYGSGELERLRALRELLVGFEVSLGDLAFAHRLRADPRLRTAVEGWLAGAPDPPASAQDPDERTPAADWLRFEQDKHQRLLANAGAARPAASSPTPASPKTERQTA